MSKHTQEEWQLAGDNQDFVYALGPNGCNKFWAVVSSAGPDKISDEEKAANARLMIAAPDLLAALQAATEAGMVPITSASEGGASRYSAQVLVADQIRAAIAKATGGA